MNTQDPHKHPLYRPHMGDMTGWEFINVKFNSRQNGDEFYNPTENLWMPIKDGFGNDYFTWHNSSLVYRRRVAPVESKQVEQKRFVTVVYEVVSKDFIAVPNSEHFKAVRYREGNAIATLDAIEDRVIAAIRKA